MRSDTAGYAVTLVVRGAGHMNATLGGMIYLPHPAVALPYHVAAIRWIEGAWGPINPSLH